MRSTSCQDILEESRAPGHRPWRDMVEPIAAKFRLAGTFGQQTSFNSDGSAAMAHLLVDMAETLDYALAQQRAHGLLSREESVTIYTGKVRHKIYGTSTTIHRLTLAFVYVILAADAVNTAGKSWVAGYIGPDADTVLGLVLGAVLVMAAAIELICWIKAKVG